MAPFAIRLQRGPLTLDVDRRGAVVTGFTWNQPGGLSFPLMRSAENYAGNPLTASCFPLVPFGNRVAGNHFSIADRTYDFTPNQPWDRHYLHGDGWLSEWSVTLATDTQINLALSHKAATGRPYGYDARIIYELTRDGALAVGIEVRNCGTAPLPFGLGLHPYFPLTPQTELRAPAEAFFAEEADFLPGLRSAVPLDLDFVQSRALPRRWINNGFTGWTGDARIAWPDRGLALSIAADTAFRDYFVFMSDKTFEPDFAGDYFCFEPMTHQANGHHLANLGGLMLLAPGDALQSRVLFTPEETLT
ncbi:aldose 1-epimerase [Acidisoma silvae]|uniref:Aldose 1-epimerase n=1 Tax=Acidisoma silvae TaxID=2802396 RepID=A0A964E1H4_9PROT|nr:aldose 1-epimerase [Acidisoma silvae]MCB8877773.1 aldose 1-epimerase [Acidisoma silvae]